MATAMQFFSLAVFSIPVGVIADRYGRLCILYPSIIGMCLVGLASAFITEYWQFLLTRFIIGICLAGSWMTLTVLVAEYVGPRYRSHALFMFGNAAAGAYLALGGMGYAMREWRILMITCSAPWIILLVFSK